ncbi:MAG: hypothetical protein VW076_00070 [Synechococcus sp.]
MTLLADFIAETGYIDSVNAIEFGVTKRRPSVYGGKWFAYRYGKVYQLATVDRAPDGLPWPPGWGLGLWVMHQPRIKYIDGIRRRTAQINELGRVHVLGPDLGDEGLIKVQCVRSGAIGFNTWHCLKKGSGLRSADGA